MKKIVQVILVFSTAVLLLRADSTAQEVKASNAQSWVFSGRVQLQHLWNNEIASTAAKTSNGFRVRRGRLQTRAKLTDWVSAKFQIEVRDNSPKLKDAEAKIKLFGNYFLRAGQFKVPVWREELRSSGKLLLVERSGVAEFLADNYLSARHVGVEFGGKVNKAVGFALNYSNGAGEGGREDAGRKKYDDNVVNNGKLFTGRVNLVLNRQVQIGISGALNQLGEKQASMDTRGNVLVLAPDFGVYLPARVDVEGGFALGSFDKKLTGNSRNDRFTLANVTVRWKTGQAGPGEALGGADVWEVAAGVSYIEPNNNTADDEYWILRAGPAICFGKRTRLQVNGEIEKPADSTSDTVLKIRSQLTVNF